MRTGGGGADNPKTPQQSLLVITEKFIEPIDQGNAFAVLLLTEFHLYN